MVAKSRQRAHILQGLGRVDGRGTRGGTFLAHHFVTAVSFRPRPFPAARPFKPTSVSTKIEPNKAGVRLRASRVCGGSSACEDENPRALSTQRRKVNFGRASEKIGVTIPGKSCFQPRSTMQPTKDLGDEVSVRCFESDTALQKDARARDDSAQRRLSYTCRKFAKFALRRYHELVIVYYLLISMCQAGGSPLCERRCPRTALVTCLPSRRVPAVLRPIAAHKDVV
jgi:hypothetical protein